VIMPPHTCLVAIDTAPPWLVLNDEIRNDNLYCGLTVHVIDPSDIA
jgi:hypothetical protein